MCKSQLPSYKPGINNWKLKFKTQYQKRQKQTKKTPKAQYHLQQHPQNKILRYESNKTYKIYMRKQTKP